jgi:DNA-binding NarL/FixJ family response regulator
MLKTSLLFGILLAILLAILKWMEFLFFARDLALETYIGLVGLVCTVLGGWIGWKLTRPNLSQEEVDHHQSTSQTENSYLVENHFGLSPREYEVLVLISNGLSYQEIADRLFISLSTVKTHASNIFSKMNVQRRTQAVMLAQQSGMLPPIKV